MQGSLAPALIILCNSFFVLQAVYHIPYSSRVSHNRFGWWGERIARGFMKVLFHDCNFVLFIKQNLGPRPMTCFVGHKWLLAIVKDTKPKKAKETDTQTDIAKAWEWHFLFEMSNASVDSWCLYMCRYAPLNWLTDSFYLKKTCKSKHYRSVTSALRMWNHSLKK